ncbi:GlcD FAD/FMN-containing dehydrogenases [Burkholderiaceae bacterium]
MDTTLAHWVAQIRAAAQQKQTLVIQGGNSKSFYGETANSANVLDTRAHSGIVSYEPSELVVTVRAGTPLAELEAVLNAQGQCLAFEPPHFSVDGQSQATVGGMVACGLAGPARANVGGVRDHVLGVQMLNGLGEWLTFGGQVMKNVAGYDVSRVMAGSMGTLGVITDVSLKVLPQAPAEATLVCHLPQDKALAVLQRWGAQPLPLNASCWVHDTTAQPAQDLLFVRLRGAVAAVESAVPRMCADVVALGGQAVAMDPTQAKADWSACRDQRLPFFTPPAPDLALWRLSVPQTAPVLPLPYAPLIEWHGALRWLWAPLSAASDLRAIAAQVGGHATLFRSPLQAPSDMPQVFSPLPAVQQRIQRQLQHQFDPHGVFNTGRLGLS